MTIKVGQLWAAKNSKLVLKIMGVQPESKQVAVGVWPNFTTPASQTVVGERLLSEEYFLLPSVGSDFKSVSGAVFTVLRVDVKNRGVETRTISEVSGNSILLGFAFTEFDPDQGILELIDAVKESSQCDCDMRDLFWNGHKCGMKRS